MIEQQPSPAGSPSICTIVVPCYNEAARLDSQPFRAFVQLYPDVHFLFVNDGSTDQTLALVQDLAAALPGHVSVLNQQPNAGKAAAVRAGMLHAVADSAFIGFWDADLATPLDAIPRFRTIFERHLRLEMVFGSRIRLMGRHVERSPMRHYAGRIFATLVSTMLRIPIYDSQCGAKLFRVTPDLYQVLAQPFQSRWLFDVEIIARFLALHRNDPAYSKRAIYEQPLDQWTEVPGSKVSPFDFVRSIWEVVQIRSRYLR